MNLMNLNQTKVYIADLACLKKDGVFERLLPLVPEYRRDKALRFKFQKGKVQSLGVGLLLKKACEESGIPQADEHVALEENGKPFFVDCPEIYFNLSHSEERAMCVISQSPVGCDVERVRGDRGELADKFFMPDESAWIKSFRTVEEQNASFCRLWTLKECYMKVTGLGLSLSPNAFGLHLDLDGVHLFHQGLRLEYTFHEFDLKDDYYYACCLKNRACDDCIELKNVDLLNFL